MLTSYSSATASDLHRLPYSAETKISRPPDENAVYGYFCKYTQQISVLSMCRIYPRLYKRGIQTKEKMVRYTYHHVKNSDYFARGARCGRAESTTIVCETLEPDLDNTSEGNACIIG